MHMDVNALPAKKLEKSKKLTHPKLTHLQFSLFLHLGVMKQTLENWDFGGGKKSVKTPLKIVIHDKEYACTVACITYVMRTCGHKCEYAWQAWANR